MTKCNRQYPEYTRFFGSTEPIKALDKDKLSRLIARRPIATNARATKSGS
jgi:hypothetical protein